MKALLPDALIVSGAVLVPLGIALADMRPMAVAVLGLECLVIGVLAARTGRR